MLYIRISGSQQSNVKTRSVIDTMSLCVSTVYSVQYLYYLYVLEIDG